MYKGEPLFFKTSLEWKGDGIARIKGKDLDKLLEVSPPPEFGGEEGFWSPEELLLAAVNSCFFATFIYYAERLNLQLIHFRSEIKGRVELREGKFVFTEITLYPEITLKKGEEDKGKTILEKAKEKCIISNSLQVKVNVVPRFIPGTYK